VILRFDLARGPVITTDLGFRRGMGFNGRMGTVLFALGGVSDRQLFARVEYDNNSLFSCLNFHISRDRNESMCNLRSNTFDRLY
jgi:hypothetical protein